MAGIRARRGRQAAGGRASRAERSSGLIALGIYRAFAIIDRCVTGALSGRGLSPTRWNALYVLHRAETPLTMGELGERLAVRPTNLSGVVKGLTRRGFAARSMNAADRRSAFVAITRRGQAFLTHALPGHYAGLEETMSALTDRERRHLVQLLSRFADAGR
jgi:DNA-binding MarR family transcriptional regulator